MKLLAAIAFAVRAVLAVVVSDGSVKCGDSVAEFGAHEPFVLTDSGSIEVRFLVEPVPHQAMVVLANDAGLEKAYFARVSSSGVAKVDIAHANIPPALQRLALLKLHLVVADFDDPEPYFAEIGTVHPPWMEFAENLEAELALHSPLPEILHQFKTEPTTVPAPVALVFAGLVAVLTLWLFGTWASIGFKAGLVSSYTPAFLLAVVAFEVLFIRYYLGTSIFTTLQHAGLLAIPTVFVGLRVLRTL